MFEEHEKHDPAHCDYARILMVRDYQAMNTESRKAYLNLFDDIRLIQIGSKMFADSHSYTQADFEEYGLTAQQFYDTSEDIRALLNSRGYGITTVNPLLN